MPQETCDLALVEAEIEIFDRHLAVGVDLGQVLDTDPQVEVAGLRLNVLGRLCPALAVGEGGVNEAAGAMLPTRTGAQPVVLRQEEVPRLRHTVLTCKKNIYEKDEKLWIYATFYHLFSAQK